MAEIILIFLRLLWTILRRIPSAFWAIFLGLRVSGYASVDENASALISGTGRSIASLDSSVFERPEQDTVGLNDFVFFDAEASHYAMEMTSQAPELFAEYLKRISKIQKTRDVFLLLKLPSSFRAVWHLSRAVRSAKVRSVALHVPLPVSYRNHHQLESLYKYWGWLPRSVRRIAPIEARGSLFRHLSMLSEAGYREISVLGIDMTNEYFWSGLKNYEFLKELRQPLSDGEQQGLHPTVHGNLDSYLADFGSLRNFVWSKHKVDIKGLG